MNNIIEALELAVTAQWKCDECPLKCDRISAICSGKLRVGRALTEAQKIKPLLEKANKRELAIKKSLDLITAWGGIDGNHHKQWLLDQVVKVIAPDYKEWVREFEDGSDGPNTYKWDEGIAP